MAVSVSLSGRELKILLNYTESFKAKMVQRMSPPDAISALRLSKEVGVSQSQLSRWLRDARTVVSMVKERRSDRVVGATPRSATEKVRIVMEAAATPPNELGAYLRREGVHEAELEQWRTAALEAATTALAGDSAPKPAAGRGAEGKRIKDLERELRRKEKALAEAAALLVLQKKVRTLLADGDDEPDDGSEK